MLRTMLLAAFAALAVTGRAAGQPSFAQTGDARTGAPVMLFIQQAQANAPLLLGIGAGLLDPPVPVLGTLYLSPPILVFPLGNASSTGTKQIPIAIPSDPSLVGEIGYLQALDLTAALLSNPLGIWIGPPSTMNSPNSQTNGFFGWAVAVGDFVGDKALDIAVGAHGEKVSNVVGAGRVYVFEGPAFTKVTTLNAASPAFGTNFGRALVALDFDNDGKTDLAVGEPNRGTGVPTRVTAGRVLVYRHPVGSSTSWTLDAKTPLIYETLGSSLAAADLNGDGRDEVIAGAPHAGGAGTDDRRLVVFSNTGSTVTSFTVVDPAKAKRSFGKSVAAGDVTGDNKAEVVVGDPTYSGTKIAQGAVYLFKPDGSAIKTIGNPNPSFNARFGESVAVGDLNADNLGDLLIGAQGQNKGLMFPGPSFASSLSLPTVRPGSIHGGKAVLIADVNGDGVNDALIAATASTSSCCGSVSFYLGPSLVAKGLLGVGGVSNVLTPGWSLAAGDLSGDKAAEVVGGAPFSSSLPGAGMALVFR